MSVRVNVSFDMRAPDWGTPARELYPAALEMAAFADRIGADMIGLMEHHGSDDGYLPQPFVLAGGIAAATKRVRLMLGAVILPLHDPVMLAEQVAVLDLMSGGRANVILGAGYVPFEFALFGKSVKDRAKLMDDGIDTILRALRGERFERQMPDGSTRPVFVRPVPGRAPEEILLVGGGVAASAKRAARFDLGFAPINPSTVDTYLEECARLGRPPRGASTGVPGMPLAVHLCEDPDAGWAAIEAHALHVVTEYAKWAEMEGSASNSPFKGLDNPEALRRSGIFAAWTPEQLLARVRELPAGANVGLQPLLGGLSPDEGWKSLKLLEKTMPRLREVGMQPA